MNSHVNVIARVLRAQATASSARDRSEGKHAAPRLLDRRKNVRISSISGGPFSNAAKCHPRERLARGCKKRLLKNAS